MMLVSLWLHTNACYSKEVSRWTNGLPACFGIVPMKLMICKAIRAR